jgi:hypothetical protein
LQSDNLDKTNFVGKIWLSDSKVACNSPFSLIELIEAMLLEEELEQYEDEFE